MQGQVRLILIREAEGPYDEYGRRRHDHDVRHRRLPPGNPVQTKQALDRGDSLGLPAVRHPKRKRW